MSETVTVWHPAPDLAGHHREVAKEDLEAWAAQGWLKSEPKASKDKAAAEQSAQ